MLQEIGNLINTETMRTSFKTILLLSIIGFSLTVNGQRYTHQNKNIVKLSEVSYLNKSVSVDSLWRSPCNSFELNLENNTQFNRVNNNCIRQGYWFYYDRKSNSYVEGYYRRGNKQGIWRFYNELDKDELKFEIDYSNGVALRTIYQDRIESDYDPFYRFLNKFQIDIIAIFIGLFLVHIGLNLYLFKQVGVSYTLIPIKLNQVKLNFTILFKLFWNHKTLNHRKYKMILYLKNALGIFIIIIFILLVAGTIIYPEGLLQ